MMLCLEDGELDPDEVDYINAHGTSTPQGDTAETQAIKHVFGEHAAQNRGELDQVDDRPYAGRGGRDRIGLHACWRSNAGCVPPTINYEHPDPECDLDYVPNRPRAAKIRLALNNSFGFGGTNTTLAFRPAVELSGK